MSEPKKEEQRFTKDDLKRFKACIPAIEHTWQMHVASTPLNLEALFARLEAAEEICEWFPKAFPKIDLKKHYGYKKWHKVCGK